MAIFWAAMKNVLDICFGKCLNPQTVSQVRNEYLDCLLIKGQQQMFRVYSERWDAYLLLIVLKVHQDSYILIS